jgi:fumarate hydratase subunit alpha
MRTIKYSDISAAVKTLCIDAATVLPADVLDRIKTAYDSEPFQRAKYILGSIIENARVAAEGRIPVCQDTGTSVFYVEIGENVRIEGGSLKDAVNAGTREGHIEGFLRGSIVSDPLFDRKNTLDNTPAVIHIDLVAGEELRIALLPKGGGCENMSGLAMLKPSDGLQGVTEYVARVAVGAGGNPCPPVMVGVGVGGTADEACALAKKAHLRPAGVHHPDERYAQLERNLLDKINASGVGPAGLGGKNTALWVSVEHLPCHIASMPVAVSINCHATRRAAAVL